MLTQRLYIDRALFWQRAMKGTVIEVRTGREMHGMHYGEFMYSRVFSTYRSNVDSKKLEKLHRDIAKAKKMQAHWAKENARLLKKARAETKSRGRAKLAIKKKK